MAIDRKRQILRAHAVPVVADADQPPPTRLNDDLNAARGGVERVLDELLHHGGRTLDDLACGDAIDKHRVETADRCGGRRIEGGGKGHRKRFSRLADQTGGRLPP